MRMLPAYIVIVLVLVGITFVLPELLTPPRTPPPRAAIQSLRTLHRAQVEFKAMKGRFGTLQELAVTGLAASIYAEGIAINRFVFSDANISAETYCIKANRWKDSAGSRDFNVIEDGEVRYVESKTLGSVVCGQGVLLSEP